MATHACDLRLDPQKEEKGRNKDRKTETEANVKWDNRWSFSAAVIKYHNQR